MSLTREQVLALAPDASSAKAATGLVNDSKWPMLGTDSDAVWGECLGSGSKPYQVQVDLGEMISRCSCPSRKFPCKHGLALLLMYAQSHPRFAGVTRPVWVDEWLASRRDRAEKKEKAAQAVVIKAAIDPATAAAAVAKREATRWSRIEAGTAELERWIADQFRRGLARFGQEQRKEGIGMAARMVDAQAPGLASRVQEALALLAAGATRHGDTMMRLGLLQLIIEGVRRRERLSSERLADLRIALGWSPDKDEVVAESEPVVDRWCACGVAIGEIDAKLTERRVWLHGAVSGRWALLQDFSYGGRGWERLWRAGDSYAATLRFYPGSLPLRAIALDVSADDATVAWPTSDAEMALDKASHMLAVNPWLELLPMWLPEATLVRSNEAWLLHTSAGTLPLTIDDAAGWGLLAFSGGQRIDAMGEWDGASLRILGARHGTLYWAAGAEI